MSSFRPIWLSAKEDSKGFAYYYKDLKRSNVLLNIFLVCSALLYSIILKENNYIPILVSIIAVVINEFSFDLMTTSMVSNLFDDLIVLEFIDDDFRSEAYQKLESDITKNIISEFDKAGITYTHLNSIGYEDDMTKRLRYIEVKMLLGKIKLYR